MPVVAGYSNGVDKSDSRNKEGKKAKRFASIKAAVNQQL
jgi:hypothetical protein